jgi:tRNA threonylcarbamoyl adenosine modification protein YjeE
MPKLVDRILSEKELLPVVELVTEYLAKKQKGHLVNIFLTGELGAGKTFLVRSILRHLGLDQECAVVSPTFGYMNEYEIDQKWYAHLDLYRMSDDFDMEDLGIEELRPYEAAFIEWPLRAKQVWKPDIEIQIDYVSSELRRYQVSTISDQ